MTLPGQLLARALAPAAIVLVALTAGAMAQVTPEQQSAIRASCRSDFMAKCSGVTPGGREALQCLQKNVAGLSSACKTAVSATIPAPTPPAAAAPAPARPAPAPTPPPPAATAPAPPPAAAAPAAPANAPPAVRQVAPKPAQLAKPAAATRQPAALPPPAPAPPPPAVAAPVPVAPPAQPATRTPNAPVVMTAVIGRVCLRDLTLHCRHIKVGDGRKLACLTARGDRLAAMCKAALKITEPVR